MGVDSIKPGLDFVQVLDEQVGKCDVMLMVIGRGWLDAKDASGSRRLDDAADFVRFEIESALRRDVSVVPMLVDSERMPAAADLPSTMRPVATRHARTLPHEGFGRGADMLVEDLTRLIAPDRRVDDDRATQIMKGVLYALLGLCAILVFGLSARLLLGPNDFLLLSPQATGLGAGGLALLLLAVRWRLLSGPQLFGLWATLTMCSAPIALILGLHGGPDGALLAILFMGLVGLSSGAILILFGRKR